MDESAFSALLNDVRPRLHRYCARMTGSVITGEDVLQDALIKALDALRRGEMIGNPVSWLFRIAHNVALDALRYEARRAHDNLDGLEASMQDEEALLDPLALAAGLQVFMHLPPLQRSAVILKDVLAYSIDDICDIVDGTAPSVKSALQRGRARLRECGDAPETHYAPLNADERARLVHYVERFNAHDVVAIREMLADDVRLELVNRLRLQGRSAVGEYFHRYTTAGGWIFKPGMVEGRPAIVAVADTNANGTPQFFILLEWQDGRVSGIRDFLFAQYAIDGAAIGDV